MEKDTFQRIIDREIPATIIYEDADVIAFNDIKPMNKGHFLVVSKTFSENLYDIEEEDLVYLITKARSIALEVTKKLNATGFKLLINNNESAGQVIFRTHVHIIPFYE
ncbi:HINT (histidine triad nucleotide-binding protein) family member [Metamycoplasma cloacale]|uniref:HIT family protein n=1 Tax=Metamycoplasma cloacale TaxID=92401 RepID=A0A2Z4LMG4_9BACT|nr:HIT family protein [Metamycoplasma cloacale]AWX42973.1 HIT family protein [Metamycoplasma cloacale]VEU79203.1 HINT (histidine triad nucleotide-binding protein) family member [Metamycoplasma cloacale]